MKYTSQWPIFILRSNSLQDRRQNHWTKEYRSQWPTLILRSNLGSYWLIIPNNNVHTWNSLQDIRQNHWTIEYRSQWPTLILRSNVGSYWFILPKHDVHTSNSLQDIRQNNWTMKYRCSKVLTLVLTLLYSVPLIILSSVLYLQMVYANFHNFC